jgi:hypothetical protein
MSEWHRCTQCGAEITVEEAALGWPIVAEDGVYCPACFGDDAFCRCGALLSATDDASDCEACAREREAERLLSVEIWRLNFQGCRNDAAE